ncbi:hypothetical protein C5167_047242 [Papaver somniferum]|uniref:Uncharacterized protein n=1 Tax=Papaver somniferum TaxID=3469 RepID=A0A4Y7LK11_PAPSO|nr:hypothetical protein C5167_047242 [Papaver somniferum]
MRIGKYVKNPVRSFRVEEYHTNKLPPIKKNSLRCGIKEWLKMMVSKCLFSTPEKVQSTSRIHIERGAAPVNIDPSLIITPKKRIIYGKSPELLRRSDRLAKKSIAAVSGSLGSVNDEAQNDNNCSVVEECHPKGKEVVVVPSDTDSRDSASRYDSEDEEGTLSIQ